MKFYEFVSTYDLHDSILNSFVYHHEKNEAILEMTLCNWRQIGYKIVEPELVPIHLLISGISKYESNPEQTTLGGDTILGTKALTKELGVAETLEMILDIGHGEGVKIIRISANDIKVSTNLGRV